MGHIIMTITSGEKLLAFREQVIEDAVSGLTIKIDAAQDGTPRLMIYGGLPCGKREFVFDPGGNFAGAAIRQLCCSCESLQQGGVTKVSAVSIQTKSQLRRSYRGHSRASHDTTV
jgi:hypothetical protein